MGSMGGTGKIPGGAAMGSGPVMALLGCEVYYCHGWWVAHKLTTSPGPLFLLSVALVGGLQKLMTLMHKSFGKCGEAVCTDMFFN